MKRRMKVVFAIFVTALTLILASDYVYAQEDMTDVCDIDEQNNQLLEMNEKKLDSLYYNADAYLTSDQNTALITVDTNDVFNIASVKFDVWTGNGSDMKPYFATIQPDGRWMSFVAVSTFGKSGNYYCLPTIFFNDGSSTTLGLESFTVSNPSIETVKVENVDSHAGTFDVVVLGVDAPSGVDFIDIVAFTNQDLSDAHVYRAYWTGYSFVAHANVGHHQYHYGYYGLSAILHTNNGLVATNSTCANVSAPQTKLDAYSADGNTYFLIAEDTPYDSTCVSATFYVWNQGPNDMRAYQGFRDGNRWLAIFSASDFQSGGNISYLVNGQMAFGPEICFGASQFSFKAASIESIWVYDYNPDKGTMGVMISGVKGLGGVKAVNEVVLTKSDFSDAYGYGAINCGNGTYLFNIDVSNHKYNYGTYVISVNVTNGYGVTTNVGNGFYTVHRPNTQSVAIPINEQADVVVASWDLPYSNRIIGIQYYVWNSGNDMRCYSTSKRQNNSYNYTFSMNDFGKAGTFYVLPRIVRDNWTTEDLPLLSFNITNINGNYGIMGSSGTNVDQMVRYFNKYGDYPLYYQLGYGGAPSINDFCRIFFEECAAENVRAEVAFCQAMKETGYLRFGGAVDVAAFNFAGIGAVDSSPGSYNWFPDIRTGIRAQVQHLKAYASTDPLNNVCVDPRFNLVTRGVAPCVEDLGGRWASGADYGYSIKRDYMDKLFAS